MILSRIIIDSEKCTLCQRCVRSCPVEILYITQKQEKEEKRSIEISDSSKCLECRACEVICPEAAITVHAREK